MLKPIMLRNLQLKDINPRVCGVHICESGEIMPRHHIQRHVLHYVTQGRGRYLCNDREYPVRAGDIFVCHRGYSTSYVADEQEPFTYIWVSFECSESFAGLMTEEVFHAPWAYSVFSQIPQCQETAVPEWAICSLLYSFFHQLAARQEAEQPRGEDYVNRAINYIQSNYPQQIRVTEMAEDLGLSRNHFSRLFRQQVGQSPQAYLVTYRMEKAARLLLQGLPQKEVAHRVGYPDVAAFSRMFKGRYGISPGEYIRRSKPSLGVMG